MSARNLFNPTASDIIWKSVRSILEYLLAGKDINDVTYDEMYVQKVEAHNFKASKEQIIDDLNGFKTDAHISSWAALCCREN